MLTVSIFISLSAQFFAQIEFGQDGAFDLVTSTPVVRKRVVVQKGRKTVGKRQVRVQVHDGVATRSVDITTGDDINQLLEKVSSLMKRPSVHVQMGYEASWSTKVGTKKCLSWLSSEAELDDFWLAYVRFVSKPGNKKKSAEEMSVEVIFHNMSEVIQVSILF